MPYVFYLLVLMLHTQIEVARFLDYPIFKSSAIVATKGKKIKFIGPICQCFISSIENVLMGTLSVHLKSTSGHDHVLWTRTVS